jgi:hypothetical protein
VTSAACAWKRRQYDSTCGDEDATVVHDLLEVLSCCALVRNDPGDLHAHLLRFA